MGDPQSQEISRGHGGFQRRGVRTQRHKGLGGIMEKEGLKGVRDGRAG